MSGHPPLSVLSWNLAMLERPSGAPLDWAQEHTQAEVRSIVLHHSPDVVTFQELPGIVPYVETHDMVRANPMSHGGNLAVLVGHDLMDEQPSVTTVERCAVLVTFADRDLTVANVHLAPGPAGRALRLDQLATIAEVCPTENLLVVGDTNTRTDEEPAIADLGLGGRRPPEPTWDSKRNRFRADGNRFTAYFTRYFHRGAVAVSDVKVLRDTAVELDDQRFHLSDHYPLWLECRFDENMSN